MMRIQEQSQSIESINSTNSVDLKLSNKTFEAHPQPSNGEAKTLGIENLNQVVDSMNEILEINHSNLKFVYHEGLEKFFVQLVNAETEQVVREIPPKKLLDAFYEMQKIVGMVVDKKI